MGRLKLLIAAFVIFLVSCGKENVADQNQQQIPPREDGEMIEMSFSAALEELDDPKTSIDDAGKVQWEAGDAVRLYWSDSGSSVMTAQTPGATTTFSKISVGVADYYYAVYPDSDQEVNIASESLSVTIPDAQDGSFAMANHIVGRTLPGGNTLYFYYASTVVKFNISRPDITEVTIRSADGSAIAGQVSIDFSTIAEASDIPVFSVSDFSDEITVSVSGPGTYYAAILPGKDIAGGMLFRARTAEDYLPAAATSLNQTSIRGKVKNYIVDGGMDSKITTDYYVSASGSGKKNGKSVQNAFDAESFAAFVGSRSDDVDGSRSQAFKLYGTTIHVDGTVAVSKTIDVAFADGAYEKPVGFSITGGKLSGGSSARILKVGNGTALRLSAMQLSDGDAADGNGGALSLESSSAKVDAVNCSFSGNKADNGGAIHVGAGLFTASKCSFTGNTAQQCGGSINAEGSGATVFLNKCKLNGNRSGDWGTAVNIGGATSFAANGSVFSGNEADGSNDASLYLKGNAVLSNCTIVEDVENSAVVQLSGSAGSSLSNSIVVGKDESDVSVHMDGATHRLVSYGGSMVGRISGSDLSAAQAFTKNISDIYNFKYKEFVNPSWDAAGMVFSWDNNSICGYRPAKTGDIMAVVSAVKNDFCTWLGEVDADAFLKDISGYSRSQNGIRPGAWEGEDSMESSSDRLSVGHLMGYYQWTRSSSGVLVMSHRCHVNSDGQTENSISAARLALASGADMLEVDPRPTMDGAIVLCHDKSIENFVNNTFIFGCDDVDEMTLSKVQSYQLVNRKYFGKSSRYRFGTGEKIPTLAEFFSGVGSPRRWYASLDCEKIISENPSTYKDILHTIADIVYSAGMIKHTFFYIHKAGAAAGEDKLTELRNAFAEWGYPDAAIEFYPYGNSPDTDSNYKWLTDFPYNVYSARVTYSPGASPHNLLHVVKDGAVGVVNMLSVLNSNIPEYGIDSSQLDELLANFPYCHIIQTDSPAELVTALSAKGLRISRYEDDLNAGSAFDGYDTGNYDW